MKFKVTGQNRLNGARMVLEMEAASKGEAQRKAEQSGMTVGHCEVIDATGQVQTSAGGQRRSSPGLVARIIPAAVAAVIAYLVVTNWSTIMKWVGR